MRELLSLSVMEVDYNVEMLFIKKTHINHPHILQIKILLNEIDKAKNNVKFCIVYHRLLFKSGFFIPFSVFAFQ